MTDPSNPSGAEPAPTPAPKPKRQFRWKLWLVGALLVPLALFALYTFTALTWSYSEGDRAGSLYKFSRKGWLCKTWEGELNITPGAAAPTIWSFTVRDADVAKQVNSALGERVVLNYSEHVGVPTRCFGDTRYFVNAIRVIKQ